MDRVVSWEGNDPVTILYNEVGFQNLIEDPTFIEENIAQEALINKDLNIPPGYKDSSKGDNPLGDLIIWKTILEIADRKQNVIFVSGDNKSDWWHKSNNKQIIPRFELVDEFTHRSVGKSFHIIPLSRLLDLFGANEQVIQEVQKEESESFLTISKGYVQGQRSMLDKQSYEDYTLFKIEKEKYYNIIDEIVKNCQEGSEFTIQELEKKISNLNIETRIRVLPYNFIPKLQSLCNEGILSYEEPYYVKMPNHKEDEVLETNE
jgi:hypothetical protein